MLSFVPCAIKQIINVVQFWKASKIVGGGEVVVSSRPTRSPGYAG